MATNFPGSLDSFTNPTSGSTLDSPSHAGQHANINDAMEAVQAKLGTGNHTIGDTETDWTPTFSNGLTIGDGTSLGRYERINDLVIAHGTVVLGSNSSVTTFVRVDVPITAGSSYEMASGLVGYVVDTSLNSYTVIAGRPYGADEVYMYGLKRNTSNDAIFLSSTIAPTTLAVGDRIHWTVTYRAA